MQYAVLSFNKDVWSGDEESYKLYQTTLFDTKEEAMKKSAQWNTMFLSTKHIVMEQIEEL